MEESKKTFVHKVFDMLESGRFREIICWNEYGNAFTVFLPETFSSKILPIYFKHANFSSFVRQLNLYGFRKVKNRSSISFMHDRFLRGRRDLLDTIKRKTAEIDLNPEDKRDAKILEMFQQIQDNKHQIKELLEDLFKEKERRHQIKVKYEELMAICRINNISLTPDFEVADLLPKPNHHSRHSWASELNSSLISPLSSNNNMSGTNLSVYAFNQMNEMYLTSPPISPERLMASNIMRNLGQGIESPNQQIPPAPAGGLFEYETEQFE